MPSRSHPGRPIAAVGAIILRDQYLLLVRRKNPPLKDEWSLPGGVVELGETLHAAVKREVLEETGLQVEPVELACVLDRILPGASAKPEYHYILIDYLCHVIGGELRPGSDVSEARWATRSELEALGVAAFTQAEIARYLT
jgi:8-oxo-dGTP diphosphatase